MASAPYPCYPYSMADASFEWDPKKDDENQSKHGVPFAEAQVAFLDPQRVIAEDLAQPRSGTTVSAWLEKRS